MLEQLLRTAAVYVGQVMCWCDGRAEGSGSRSRVSVASMWVICCFGIRHQSCVADQKGAHVWPDCRVWWCVLRAARCDGARSLRATTLSCDAKPRAIAVSRGVRPLRRSAGAITATAAWRRNCRANCRSRVPWARAAARDAGDESERRRHRLAARSPSDRIDAATGLVLVRTVCPDSTPVTTVCLTIMRCSYCSVSCRLRRTFSCRLEHLGAETPTLSRQNVR